MKKASLVTVAVIACLSQAGAGETQRGSLPQEVQGTWCQNSQPSIYGWPAAGVKIAEFIKLDDCPSSDSKLMLTSYRLDVGDESSCDIMKVKVIGKTYRVTSICAHEGDLYDTVDTIWLVNKTLRIRSDSVKRRKANN
jgi:hypothetical protein